MSDSGQYITAGGVRVTRESRLEPCQAALESTIDGLDRNRGLVLSSHFEYPGRYTRWAFGFLNPPLALSCRGHDFSVNALNPRGRVLLPAIAATLRAQAALSITAAGPERIAGRVVADERRVPEEQRSRRPSIFHVIRALIAMFASDADRILGLYGAFGFDLVYQFEPIPPARARPQDQRDLVLYLPDEVVVVDHQRETAERVRYDFEIDDAGTYGLPRGGATFDYRGRRREPTAAAELAPGAYADVVRKAHDWFARGDLFEVVPGYTLFESTRARPSTLFRRLTDINPSPYGFCANLGGEYLIGSSPEMFVRVDGRRVETCPISGTVPRGRDALEDAEQIRTLLNSDKDRAELTMCTDVDRNDKARVCEPGSIRVLGRRQIELYSHLIHTVDHLEGYLRPELDGLDAFLTHCWAVTVTGAPKRRALEFIEAEEVSTRRWYGGAVGRLGFDGSVNTGLTLRTIRLQDCIAEIRVGATLLHDSDPHAEEAETRTKAAAMLAALRGGMRPATPARAAAHRTAPRRHVLMVDFEDSFVHTLASYLRACGCAVTTLRHGFPASELAQDWDLVVLSPGPGRPADFRMDALIGACRERGLPVFGVCLGMQGIVEHYGGSIGQLPVPMHGKPSRVRAECGSVLFRDLPEHIEVGRYHSLYAEETTLPRDLRVSARSDDGIVMAVEHVTDPVAGVQFHPESIMSLGGGAGLRLLQNWLGALDREAM